MRISIVIPIYNTAEFLPRCIDSLLEQDYRDLELILVDDGSTDDSGRVSDEYAQKDSRVKVIHKSNGGEASARNVGLEAVTGEFVGLCDSDDEYPAGSISALAEAVNSLPSVDLAIGAYLEKTETITRIAVADRESYTAYEAVVTAGIDGTVYGTRYIFSTVDGKLFRTEIIRKHHIRFLEKMRNGGNDTVFVRDFLEHCRDIKNVFRPTYIYYKYNVQQREQTTARLGIDSFLLVYHVYKKEVRLIQNHPDSSDTQLHAVYQQMIHALIANMVLATVYEADFPYSLECAIGELIQTELVSQAIQYYKPLRRMDSMLIPEYIQEKKLNNLMTELRERAKAYEKKQGRQRLLQMYYPYDNNMQTSLLPI